MTTKAFRIPEFSLVLCVFLASFFPVGCRTMAEDKFIKVIFPDGDSIRAELAVSDEERQRGLMFRESLSEDQGMLFVFDEEGYYSFWMKNTWISLDIIWLDTGKRIVHIETDVPPCLKEPCPSYGPRLPALYVLEMKAGSAEIRGLRLFDRIEFILPDGVKRSRR